MENYTHYLLPAVLLAYFVWRFASRLRAQRAIPRFLERGARVVDVRSPGEFAAGHGSGSVNIPLDQLAAGAEKLDKSEPVLVCCASGMRSGVAAGLLRKQGFTQVLNAGRWQDIAAVQERVSGR